jgi:hypothetical protein
MNKLKRDELKPVVEVVQHSPECFPQGTLTVLKERRLTSPKASARSLLPGCS